MITFQKEATSRDCSSCWPVGAILTEKYDVPYN